MAYVSWSQLKMYLECPKHWKLAYIDKIKDFEPSVVLVFGTAIHEVIQEYLVTFYNQTSAKADALDLNEMLQDAMSKEYLKSKKSFGKDFATQGDMVEFYNDGLRIIDYFKKHRNAYFPKKDHKLLGVEFRLQEHVKGKLHFIGYIDVIIQNIKENTLKIIDLKSSIRSWSEVMKKDKLRTDQLLLYKKFYSRQFNIPENKIEVEFLILKRKLYENCDYPQKRLQVIAPSQGNISVNKVMRKFDDFVETCFTEDGSYNIIREYKATPSKKTCTWCPFKTNKELCEVGKK